MRFELGFPTTIFLRNLGRCVSRMCHRQLSSAFTKWSGRSFALKDSDSVKRLANHLKRWLRWKRNRAFLKWTAIVGATNLTKGPPDGDVCLRRWLLRQASDSLPHVALPNNDGDAVEAIRGAVGCEYGPY